MGSEQHVAPKPDIEIARQAELRPIVEVAGELGIGEENLLPYGHDKAKVSLDYIRTLGDRPDGKLILVAGITPTKAGEGKTTATVGLGDALRRIGRQASICLREPSLGPCFGMKGGAAGGGYAQVVPMEDINLHFTGDMHAIGAAHNLLAALVDNHIYWDNECGIDSRRVVWRRVMDMNDRALREITAGLGGVTNGYPRTDGFDITVASEVMAILCLAEGLTDLRERIGRIIVGYDRAMNPVHAADLEADGAMTVLLKDAIQPNLVQTLEHTPTFVHGGPFANIAHGCNSVLATRTALKLSDYVVTEAGFGADLGAEKFFDIKCRSAGLKPDCAVIVATIRALKMHGGVTEDKLDHENLVAVAKGFDNLARHVENTRSFGVPVVVALNRFSTDTKAEFDMVRQACAELDILCVACDHWAEGSAGAVELAEAVVDLIERDGAEFRYLYPEDMPLWDKIRTVAQNIYRAQGIIADQKVRDQIARYQETGYGHFPVCIAKTPLSFTTDPNVKGIPKNHVVPVREVRLANGAGFLVAICGNIMTMPGLPRRPAARNMRIDADGKVDGLA
ncbi:formate--tetrahydrofolate ligase [Lentisalinibacter orientalis]|uniref:formate--tetrahydrofolate ligase n=1 Tax=Lentisalinibacter orientalis TaxID=2992241 RepID=UPI00386EE87B